MWTVVRDTNIIGLSKSDWLNSMHLKTMQLSCNRLTSSVYPVDCSCLHLTLISESQNQSFGVIENDVSGRLFKKKKKLLANISLHKRHHAYGLYEDQFQHRLSFVSLSTMMNSEAAENDRLSTHWYIYSSFSHSSINMHNIWELVLCVEFWSDLGQR